MDKALFAEQVLSAEKQLYGTAKSILHNEDDCADAVQNAILKAYDKLHTLKNDAFFKTWLTRILINECYRIHRSRAHEIPQDPQEGLEGMDAAYDTGHSEIYDSLLQLKDIYRLPVVLHYVEGYSVKETADILKLSEHAVKQRLLRGRRALRELLEE